MSHRLPKVVPSGELLDVPAWRVATCHRWTHGPGPALWRAPDRTAAEYADVYTCGSVWHCPVCSAKITGGRRAELIAAIGAWRGRGGEVYLVTRTHSHSKHERPLPDQVKALAGALSRAKGTRRALAVAERAGVVGTIRALEVTHGEMNGWHPHTHELVFARPGQLGRLLSLRNGWIRTLLKRGLAGMREGMTRAERAEQLRYLREHAMQVQPGEFAAEYVASFGLEPATESGRWGPASEITRGHMKAGERGGRRLSGRTPFELLRLYTEGDKRAGMLFRDYAIVFNGRAQLYWSPELRANLTELCRAQADEVNFARGAVPEWTAWETRARYIGRDLSDDDFAAARTAACTEFVARLDSEGWRAVLRANARHELLLAAQLDGAPGVAALIERLRGEHGSGDPPEHRASWARCDRGRWRDAA